MTEPINSVQSTVRLSPSKKQQPLAGDPPNQLEEACRDFESVFIQYMLQQMRRTVPTNDLFNGGRAEEMMTSMMDTELSKSIAQQRSIGLAAILYRQLNAAAEPEPSYEKKI